MEHQLPFKSQIMEIEDIIEGSIVRLLEDPNCNISGSHPCFGGEGIITHVDDSGFNVKFEHFNVKFEHMCVEHADSPIGCVFDFDVNEQYLFTKKRKMNRNGANK